MSQIDLARRDNISGQATARLRQFSLVLTVICLLIIGAAQSAQGAENRYRKAQKEVAEGNFPHAVELYREMLAKNEKDIEARLGLSTVWLKQRNLQESYNEAAKTLEFDQRNAHAYALIGMALLRSGILERASESLAIALHLNERDPLALAGAAELDLYENRPQSAYTRLKRATNLQADEPDFWLIFARSSSRLEYFREAAEALRQFLRYAPKGDIERRARIEGVIKFYTFLGDTHIYQISGDQATIPLQIKGRRPYLEIKINGKDKLRFVIDTGAGVSVISQEAAEKLGIREIAHGGNARAVGGEGSFPIIYGLIDEMELGGLKINSVPVYIRRIHSTTNAKPEDVTDGFLGLSVLSNFLITLDYKSAEMRLEAFKPEPNGKDSAAVVPALPVADTANSIASTIVPFRTTESGLISVEGKLDGEANLNFIFDSGASSSVISADVVEQRNWQSKIMDEVVRVIGAAGVTDNVRLLRADKLQIVDLMRENLRMPILKLNQINEHAGFEQQGILGGDFLHTCRVQIDFRHLQLTITPQNSSLLKRATDTVLLDKKILDSKEAK